MNKRKVKLYTYEEAEKVVHGMSLITQREYKERCKEDERLPRSPYSAYINKGWEGWKQFLNTKGMTNQKIYLLKNSLQKRNPQLASEWDYEANHPLTPADVPRYANKKYGWICPNGHKYVALLDSRSKGKSCPICNKRVPISSYNLMVVRPDIGRLWDYKKNFPLTPYNIMPTTQKKYWFICKNRHSRYVSVYSMTKTKGCPICDKRKATADHNFKVAYPDIAEDWDYERNKGKKPEDFLPRSAVKVWWRCIRGHRIKTQIFNRINRRGCVFCNKGRGRASDVYNFALMYPFSATQWDYQKNYPVKPTDVSPMSAKVFWWICPKKHRHKMTVYQKAKGGQCNVCHSKYSIKKMRIIAEERGGKCLSKKYKWNRKLEWICGKGHVWKATGYEVVSGSWCKICGIEKAKETRAANLYERKYKTLEEARNAVVRLKIKTHKEYIKRRKEDIKLVGQPQYYYKDWTSWDDYINKKT